MMDMFSFGVLQKITNIWSKMNWQKVKNEVLQMKGLSATPWNDGTRELWQTWLPIHIPFP